tara:strand:- start:516 stop:740 length:225 start_codon:yes stop_codon:yes gene_type:complete
MPLWDLLIWTGAAVSVAGLLGIIWCIVKVARLRGSTRPEEETRRAMQSAVSLNLAAFFLSIIGLMMVVIGVILS